MVGPLNVAAPEEVGHLFGARGEERSGFHLMGHVGLGPIDLDVVGLAFLLDQLNDLVVFLGVFL